MTQPGPLPAPRTFAGYLDTVPDTAVVLVRQPDALTVTLPTGLAWGIGLLCAIGAATLVLSVRGLVEDVRAWRRAWR